MIRKLLFVTAFGLVYTGCTMVLMLAAMGAAMSGFEPGTKAVGPTTWRVLSAVTEAAMLLPLGPLLSSPRVPPIPAYALIFANGVAWGMIVLVGWHFFKRLGGRRVTAA